MLVPSGGATVKVYLESLQAKRLSRAFKQSVSREPSSKASLESLQAMRLELLFFFDFFPLPLFFGN